jgi:methionyl-tRNA formyltransferase
MLTVNVYSSSLFFVSVIKKFFTIKKVFSDKIDNKNLKKFCNGNSIHFQRIIKYTDLKRSFTKNIDLGLVFGFGLIFKKNYISQFKYGIWNFHPGDLPKYRGRHPITWAFLNDEKKVGLTIHSINEKIDQGFLIHKYFVKRNYNDDQNSILKKITKRFSKEIPCAIKNFFSNNVKKLSKGHYYPTLFNGTKDINSNKKNSKYAYNAVKAQKIYGGAKIDGQLYRDVFFFKKNFGNKYKNKSYEIIKFKDNKRLILLKK